MLDLVLRYRVETSSTWISVIPLLLFAYRKTTGRGELRYVFVFALVNLAFQWWMLYKCSIGENNLFFWNLFVVVRYYFVSTIFYKCFRVGSHKKAILVLAPFFAAIALADWINVGYYHSFKYAHLAECVFAGSFCLLFYKELLIYLPVRFLLKYPMFYISSGLLVFYCGNLFLSPLSYYLNVHPYNLHMAFFIIMPYFLESMLLLIISFGVYLKES